jgi:DNA-binding response OmpR family regulator
MRLLLADDEKELTDALSVILTYNKYSVDAVYNGQDALDYALERRIRRDNTGRDDAENGRL